MSLSYNKSGVNIHSGNILSKYISKKAKTTHNNKVLPNILGGFGGIYKFPTNEYKNAVLVSSTDGVGTKIKLNQLLDIHHNIGIDLVAMCVNDIIVYGAKPLFFLIILLVVN